MTTKVLVIGGGYAGVRAARTLAQASRSMDIQVTVIDQNSYHTLRTVLHEVAGNRLKPNSVTIPFAKIFAKDDVTFIKDRVTAVDFAAKTVQAASGEHGYDYLIMGLGSTSNYLGVPGAQEFGYSLWNYHDALKIRKHVRECFAQAQLCQDSAKRRALLTFAVIGSGATGVEIIGELARWMKELCASHRINRSAVRLLLCDRSPRVLKTLCEANSQKAQAYLSEKQGVEIRLGVTVEAVSADGLVVSGETIPAQTVIWAAGVRASELAEQFDIEKRQARRLAVDAYGETIHSGVYVVGDLSGLTKADGKLYPAMAENAFYTGEGVAKNILSAIRKQPQKPLKIKSHGSIVCMGSTFAVAELGKFIFPGWMATIMKGIVTIHYVWQLTGLTGIKRYAFHEFFEAA